MVRILDERFVPSEKQVKDILSYALKGIKDKSIATLVRAIILDEAQDWNRIWKLLQTHLPEIKKYDSYEDIVKSLDLKESKSLKEGYILDSCTELRDALEDKDYPEVVECLKECWREIHDMLPEYCSDDELEEIESEIDSILDEDESEQKEFLDYQLSYLYNFCDTYHIQIDMRGKNWA